MGNIKMFFFSFPIKISKIFPKLIAPLENPLTFLLNFLYFLYFRVLIQKEEEKK